MRFQKSQPAGAATLVPPSASTSPPKNMDALRRMVLLRWSVGEVGAGSVTGGAAGGARFDLSRLGEGRVPSRD
jgi:hypothetical protein